MTPADRQPQTRTPVQDVGGYARPVGDTDEAEDVAWDAFYETMGARCCDCPSCNHYLPEGEYKPESECVMRAAIEQIIAARTAAAPDPAGDTDAGAAVERVRALAEEWDRLSKGESPTTRAIRAALDGTEETP